MNEIKVITELCAEDRAALDRLAAKLDRLAEALEKNIHNCASCVQSAIKMTQAGATPAEEAKNEPQESVEQEAPATTPSNEEKPAEAKETAAEEPAEPSVTLAQIQQKVVQLCAANSGAKKDKVRAIINAYVVKVSDLKDHPDKWDEVWNKLNALEEV